MPKVGDVKVSVTRIRVAASALPLHGSIHATQRVLAVQRQRPERLTPA